MVLCNFCGSDKNITTHHLVARKYKGDDEPSNLMPNICRSCHDKIEENMNKSRGDVGAGKNVLQIQSFMIGSVQTQLNAGSVYLNEQGKGYIDAGSPFYGLSCHIKNYGQKNIELALSGGSIVITGSPTDSWLIYSYANR